MNGALNSVNCAAAAALVSAFSFPHFSFAAARPPGAAAQPLSLAAEPPLVFESPIWLLLLLLLVPCFLLALRSIGGLSRTKAVVTFAIRAVVILLLATALARPSWQKRGEGLTVAVLMDVSQSIPLTDKRESVEFLRRAAEAKTRRDDRVAVVTVAKDANIASMPDRHSAVSLGQEPADRTATNLAAGVRLVLALLPDDTANRIVLASDGNETMDSVLAAAEVAAANNVPIDVLIIDYEHTDEVIFDRIVAPARVRQGQTANIKLVMRSQTQAPGTVYLSMNDEPMDINGDEPGTGLHITLEPGLRVIPVTISLDDSGPQRFEAHFEPDDSAIDRLDRNNNAVAVTFVGGEGKVLVVDDGITESEHLVRALEDADIEIDRLAPDALVGGLVFLSAYDAVYLCNIPRYAFDEEQDRMLHAYVHDLGGGLVMLGGPRSFGAGGWIDSETSKALPIKLDPPQTRQMPRGALALIMHSCEMAQGNFWGQKVAEAAIEALSRLDYVGIVEFNWGNPGAGNLQGCSWAFPMQVVGDKTAALAATKKMVVGDMPSFAPSMTLALQGLTGVRAGQRHAIIISDGDPSPPSQALLNQYNTAGVTVTTVMVGGHGTAIDRTRMQAVAQKTGGRFYNVLNPKQLPQIFIKEAQLVSRSLIQEGDIYSPRVVSRLPGPIESFSEVPQIGGYVLTAPREGLAQVPIVNATTEGNDPIYAFWNFGLGKSVAYTSDLTGRWGPGWVSWSQFRNFWEQTTRWVMRPSSPANMLVNTRMEGDLAIVEIEALESDSSFLNFMRTNAVVLGPSGDAQPLPLQQTGPGRYRGQFAVSDAGAYLVNVNYAGAGADGPTEGNLQAAVSVPYSREFRAVMHNGALLKELAARTGGRVLADNDPALVELFDRTDLEVPRSLRRIWDLLAIIAAVLFLFDVAARRLAVDPKWVSALLGRAVSAREDASSQTVAAWKRTRQQVHQERSRTEQREGRAERGARFVAGESDQATAIDVGAEVPEDMRPAQPAPQRPAKPADQPDQDDGDYTSRLLRAKRRARGDDTGENEGGGGER